MNSFASTTMEEQVNRVNNGLLHDVKVAPTKNYENIKDPVLFHNASETALKGIIEESGVSKYFFSEMNIKILQKTIRYNVHQKINKVISEQSKTELNVIMRSIFLQYGNSLVSSNDIVEHLQYLNNKVVDFSVKQIVNQVQQYGGYLDKLSTLPTPIEHPIYDNKRNFTYDVSNLL